MLERAERTNLSKAMTFVLRHRPEAYGLALDPEDGSVDLSELLAAIRKEPRWKDVTEADIEEVVRGCEKQRFELTDDRIRARYGHSSGRVQYPAAVPPEVLYHGTNDGAREAILREGLKPMGRQYVHLSEGLHFAHLAGRRRGALVILQIDTRAAIERGVIFYEAGREVWLADHIPVACVRERE